MLRLKIIFFKDFPRSLIVKRQQKKELGVDHENLKGDVNIRSMREQNYQRTLIPTELWKMYPDILVYIMNFTQSNI